MQEIPWRSKDIWIHQVENRNYHARLTWRKLWAMSSVSFTRSSNAPNTPPGCPLPGLPGRSGVLLLSPLFPNPLGQRGSILGLGMMLSPCGQWESLGCCGRKKGGSALSQRSVLPFDVSPSVYSVRDSTTSTGLHKPLTIVNKTWNLLSNKKFVEVLQQEKKTCTFSIPTSAARIAASLGGAFKRLRCTENRTDMHKTIIPNQ